MMLRRQYAARIRRHHRRGMLPTFGAGTEVLPRSVSIDLETVLTGDDITYRFPAD